ncbi:carbonyl reductase [NADPH] 1-like [Dendronephthya gigantea]|uniref:carbonyl reductase [NADPH] 1-like n=1 Tax=Dendronephthya gigantea TaxID=151771 RepID=UPI00106A7923|nr:carbonyl reductase [NADPH] 1-like [Dendronephthya gigantea]
MSASRVAVVTGGNKGIGYEIVKELCSKFAGIVYLTARDKDRGLAACERLVMEGCKNPPKFHQLDIASEESVEKFRDHIKETYQGLDVLVNNAGMAYKKKSTAPFAEQAENTIKVNFLGTLNLCKSLFPLLKPHARVVNVASMAGMLRRITTESLKDELTRPDITESELVGLIQQFVDATKAGDHESKGWPTQSYAVSKLALNILTTIQARDRPYDKDTDVLINSCCPGWCRTDMAGPNATKSAAEGAETPVFLALIPPRSEQPHGKFYFELKEISWK